LTGGTLTAVLNELTESGFVEKIYPFENLEKNVLYRLIDEFSLFYFRFMQNYKGSGKEQWFNLSESQTYKSWCGYAYENISFKHIPQIKKALQIGGIQSTEYSWYKAGNDNEDGGQIDLLIDRADRCINVCEIKFSTQPFVIDKKYATDLRKKMMIFRQSKNTRKQSLLTFITTYGLADNEYKQELVDCEITMEALFE
jgi:hypothetical protein